jgi:hypothetical protein
MAADTAGARVLVSVRLPRSLVQEIARLCFDLDVPRAALVEHFLRDGLKRYEGRLLDVAPGAFHRARGILPREPGDPSHPEPPSSRPI